MKGGAVNASPTQDQVEATYREPPLESSLADYDEAARETWTAKRLFTTYVVPDEDGQRTGRSVAFIGADLRHHIIRVDDKQQLAYARLVGSAS
jgi:hypothetical protein